MTTYRLEVRFRDGTGHNYTKLTRSKVATLTARQFATELYRPETIKITTERTSTHIHNVSMA